MDTFTERIESSHTEEAPVAASKSLWERAVYAAKHVGHFARLLLGLMTDDRVDRKVKVFVGAVLAYIFAPVDFIPELFSGLFGLADDFVLSAFALNVILNWVDPSIVKSHWKGDDDLLVTIQKGLKNAELLVPEAILKKIQTWIGKQTERAIVLSEAQPPAPVQQEERPKTKRKKRTTRKQQ